jgi:hypothetical protein
LSIICEFKPNGVIVWHREVITDDDLFKANKELYSHIYDEGFQFQLLDLSEVVEFDVSDEAMRYLADMDRKFKKDTKQFACVVAPTSHTIAKSTLWKILSTEDDFENKVVNNIDDAIEWFKLKGININL